MSTASRHPLARLGASTLACALACSLLACSPGDGSDDGSAGSTTAATATPAETGADSGADSSGGANPTTGGAPGTDDDGTATAAEGNDSGGAESSTGEVELPPFSFFVTSLVAMQELSRSAEGFGGDLISERSLDDDKLTHADEVNRVKTNPLNPDTDGDGVIDGEDDCPLIKGVKSSENERNGCPPAPKIGTQGGLPRNPLHLQYRPVQLRHARDGGQPCQAVDLRAAVR